jgi:ABC-type transport system involved in multi-copper enzyme maturation permease subunit
VRSSAEVSIVSGVGVDGEDFGRGPLVGPAPTLSPFPELWTVTRAELRRTVRSARALLLLLIFGTFTLLAGLVVGAITRGIEQQMDPTQAIQARSGLLALLVDGNGEALRALSGLPVVVPLVFRLTLVFLPLYVALLGFDQLSSEVGSRSVRYLVVRSRRASILLGKFAAQALVLAALVAVVVGGLFLAAGFKADLEDPLGYAGMALRFWAAGMTLALAYLALTTLASSITSTPAGSLFTNLGFLLASWALYLVGARGEAERQMTGNSSWTESLKWLSPSAYSSGLLGPSSATVTSMIAYACFAAVFLAGAWVTFRVRDV